MNPTTKILALACAGLLALTGTAAAHHGATNATVYGAKLAAPDATTATTTATDPATAIRGKALLVDGSQTNVLKVHVRNLKPNTAYTFELSSAPPDQAEAPVADFATTTATTNEDGKLRGFVKSATFNAADGATYSVLVKEGDTVVASGQLQALPFHKRFGHRRGHKHGFRGHRGFKQGAQGAHSAQSGDPGHGCDGDKGQQS
jgi:hypothetical protein